MIVWFYVFGALFTAFALFMSVVVFGRAWEALTDYVREIDTAIFCTLIGLTMLAVVVFGCYAMATGFRGWE